VLQCVAVCCSVLQCVAVCCSVLQCVVVRLQCVAVCRSAIAECCNASVLVSPSSRSALTLLSGETHGVATISRLLKITGFFCRISSLL